MGKNHNNKSANRIVNKKNDQQQRNSFHEPVQQQQQQQAQQQQQTRQRAQDTLQDLAVRNQGGSRGASPAPTLSGASCSERILVSKGSLSPVTKLDGSSPIREPENLPIPSTGSSTGCSSGSDSSDRGKRSSPPVIHWEPDTLLTSLHKKTDQPISSYADPADPLAAAAAAIRAHPLLMTPQGLALQQHVQQLLRDQLIHPQVCKQIQQSESLEPRVTKNTIVINLDNHV